MKKILTIMAVLLVAACSGPNNHSSCIPDKSSGATTADGKPVTKYEEIDEKLREKKIVSTIVEKIKKMVVGNSWNGGAAQSLFSGFVNSSMFRMGLSAAFGLYVIIYGVMIIGGLTNASLGDAVIRILKMAFITYLGLNWGTFYTVIGSASMNATDELIRIIVRPFDQAFGGGGGGISVSVLGMTFGSSNLFSSLDNLLASMFSMRMIAVLSAMFMSSGPSTPIYGMLVIVATYYVFMGLINAVLVYCFSLFARALLFAIAPIFLTFLLFNQTKQMFEMWVKQLINYTLQPVFVMSCLGLLTYMISPFLAEIQKETVCWRQIEASKEVYGWVFVDGSYNPKSFGPSTPTPIELQKVMLYFCFAYIFFGFQKVAQQMATGLTSVSAASLFDAANLQNFKNFVKSPNKAASMTSRAAGK